MAPLSRPEFKQQIQQMDSRQFEFFIADIWAARGWETQVTQQSGDGGIDVEVTRDSERRLIQVKRYSDTTVGRPDVQQYASLQLSEEDVDTIIIVTSNRFSPQAERYAPTVGVEAIDADILYDIIVADELYSVVSKYLDFPQQISRSQSTQSPTSDAAARQIPDGESPAQTIRQAISEERRIRMKYQSRSGTRVREVEPYGIATRGQLTYFVGYDDYRSDVRYFRVKKTLWIQLTDEEFTIPPDFDINSYLNRKNPAGGGSQCFIATAAIGSENTEELRILRVFRDSTLSKSVVGRLFIQSYYRLSPPVANWIAQSKWRQASVRVCVVYPAVFIIKQIGEATKSE